jgi:hypothetical protein
MSDNPFDDLDIPELNKQISPHKDLTIDRAAKMINRLAAIEDELARRGNDALLKEKKKLREQLKKLMLDQEVNLTYDETSNFEGVLSQRHEDTWDLNRFKESVPKSKFKRYIQIIPKTEQLDVAAVVEGVKNGDLSLAQLTVDGAFTRTPTSKALYVKEREDDSE